MTADAALPSSEQIVASATRAMFGKALVTNVFRSMLVEAMIAEVLKPDWTWCAADYAPWDFESAAGVRLEVKQSAARQSWAAPKKGPTAGRFDIAHRQGRWEGSVWTQGRQRFAQLYVLAHHPIAGPEADHRDPSQWRFYVVATHSLPEAASIGLPALCRLAEPVTLAALASEVARTATALSHFHRLELYEDHP